MSEAEIKSAAQRAIDELKYDIDIRLHRFFDGEYILELYTRSGISGCGGL